MIENILAQRGKRYGEFNDNAAISQYLKQAMHSAPNWEIKPDNVREALENIQQKIARILNGDDAYPDNWVDIIGYAKLVLKEIDPEQAT